MGKSGTALCKSKGVRRYISRAICTTILSYVGIIGATLAAEPSAKLIEKNIVLDSMTSTTKGALVLDVTELNKKNINDNSLISKIEDVAAAAPAQPEVIFDTKGIPLVPGETNRQWVLPFTIKKLSPATKQVRYVQMLIGQARWTFPFTLSNSTVPPAWSILTESRQDHYVSDGESVPINIAIFGNSPVIGVRLAPAPLVDQTANKPLAGGELVICKTAAPCDGKPFDVQIPGGVVWLSAKGDAAKHARFFPGTYLGVVTLVSVDKPRGEKITVAIKVTSGWWKALGTAIIAIGVGIAYRFTSFMRNRLVRNELLTGAVELRQRIDALHSSLKKLKKLDRAPAIEQRLKEENAALSDTVLEKNGLPRRIPRPFVPPDTAAAAKLEAYLTPHRAAIDALELMINEGLVALREILLGKNRKYDELTDEEASAFSSAWHAIDVQASGKQIPDRPSLESSVGAEVAGFRQVLNGTSESLPTDHTMQLQTISFRQSFKVNEEVRSPEKLRSRITIDSSQSWLFTFSITTVAGTYLLVLDNAGFGTIRDLFGCLLWGVGVPTSTLFATTTASNVSSTVRSSGA